jgi:hypothetical protein
LSQYSIEKIVFRRHTVLKKAPYPGDVMLRETIPFGGVISCPAKSSKILLHDSESMSNFKEPFLFQISLIKRGINDHDLNVAFQSVDVITI